MKTGLQIGLIANLLYRFVRRARWELGRAMPQVLLGLDSYAYRAFRLGACARGRADGWMANAPWGGQLDDPSCLAELADRNEAAAIVAAAERACANEFDLLGSGPYRFPEEIDWHLDFKSGHRWCAATHHSRIGWEELPPGVDIKVPWELSRCQHFATLGLAYRLTGTDRYYDVWKEQTLQWIAANPVGYGVNWTCAMDVAIRAVNWLNAVFLFGEKLREENADKFVRILDESLWRHGLHITRNLEWAGPGGRMTGNHFIANLTGLFGIGIYFRNTRRGRRWWRWARKQLEFEMGRQVLADGAVYETSTFYHRLVMEMFLWVNTLAARVGEPHSACWRDRLKSMAAFVRCYTTPGGNACQFGDNDNGRLLCAGIDDGRDHRYLADGDCGFGGRLNRLLLVGSDCSTGRVDRPKGFPDGGFYFMERHGWWVALRAGHFGQGGAHAHCDQLAILLCVGDEEVLVDRGTATYTPDTEKRNSYRGSASHNVLTVNDWEQNPFHTDRRSAFAMPDTTLSSVSRWEPENGIWEARHFGYNRMVPGMECTRRVELADGRLVISDKVKGLRSGDFLRMYFHFAPGLDLRLDSGRLWITGKSFRAELAWDFPAEAEMRIVGHSSAYGEECRARALCLTVTGPLATDAYVTFIKPFH